ncbi:unnamed protein product [Linum trigynum]|uniref:Uncharacterized protein n=1 Tax=Linum trigynum TaxID=586398 RepID=A0AAV2FBP4_9ROSI
MATPILEFRPKTMWLWHRSLTEWWNPCLPGGEGDHRDAIVYDWERFRSGEAERRRVAGKGECFDFSGKAGYRGDGEPRSNKRVKEWL